MDAPSQCSCTSCIHYVHVHVYNDIYIMLLYYPVHCIIGVPSVLVSSSDIDSSYNPILSYILYYKCTFCASNTDSSYNPIVSYILYYRCTFNASDTDSSYSPIAEYI